MKKNSQMGYPIHKWERFIDGIEHISVYIYFSREISLIFPKISDKRFFSKSVGIKFRYWLKSNGKLKKKQMENLFKLKF